MNAKLSLRNGARSQENSLFSESLSADKDSRLEVGAQPGSAPRAPSAGRGAVLQLLPVPLPPRPSLLLFAFFFFLKKSFELQYPPVYPAASGNSQCVPEG